jgi:hypothetical protein
VTCYDAAKRDPQRGSGTRQEEEMKRKCARLSALGLAVSLLCGCVAFEATPEWKPAPGPRAAESISSVTYSYDYYSVDGELDSSRPLRVGEQITAELEQRSLLVPGEGPAAEVKVVHRVRSNLALGVLSVSTLLLVPSFAAHASEVRATLLAPDGTPLASASETQSFSVAYGVVFLPLVPFVGSDAKIPTFWHDSAVRLLESLLREEAASR